MHRLCHRVDHLRKERDLKNSLLFVSNNIIAGPIAKMCYIRIHSGVSACKMSLCDR